MARDPGDIRRLLAAAGAFAGRVDDLVECLERSTVGIVLVEPAGTIAWCNPAMSELLGVTFEACAGRSLAELYAEPDVLADIWSMLRAGEPVRERLARLRVRGGEREVILSADAGRDRDGALLGARFCVRAGARTPRGATDIAARVQAERERAMSELKDAEQALRHSEQRFRTLIEVSTQILWTTDAEGKQKDSPTWRAFTGQTYEEMRDWGWTTALAPEDRARVSAEWRAAVSARRLYQNEYRLRRADGTYADVEARAVPLFDPDGSVREWVGVNVDVSAQRQSERQREALVADLRRAMHYQEMFVGVLSHDLRSPLSAMLMATEVALRRCTDERQQRFLRQISDSGERMRRMIEELLDVTRIRTGGGLALRCTRADLALICRTIIDEVQQARPGARIVLNSCGSTLGTWDVDRLSQLASNLICNAIQHAEGAPVATVTLDGRDPSSVRFVVHNRGAIPAERLAGIFDPFRRAATAWAGHGLGLGLYITQQIALAHGGSVSVESTDADGTFFRVELPREDPSCGSSPSEPTPIANS
jgi:PAS domain S-box-containing protein